MLTPNERAPTCEQNNEKKRKHPEKELDVLRGNHTELSLQFPAASQSSVSSLSPRKIEGESVGTKVHAQKRRCFCGLSHLT